MNHSPVPKCCEHIVLSAPNESAFGSSCKSNQLRTGQLIAITSKGMNCMFKLLYTMRHVVWCTLNALVTVLITTPPMMPLFHLAPATVTVHVIFQGSISQVLMLM